MAQTYRDPTFEEVARREAQAQRQASMAEAQAERDAEWRASKEYRRMRRQRIRRLTLRAMNGR
ncbi:hypothetical protein [Aquitalea magnusonii]|uniref:Uncharacterized protein n=1 Tax=Aquitalea magnusonii TaxID=332411 RepID=A0A318JW84_9NEIS|nr:hypothetical protein [Aquitalea magnusonii]PXX49392.1 hypothetical protein DFR38_10432 [Aquitalea magnusonii]